MDTEEPAEPFQNSLYPYFMQYGQGIPLTGVNLDYIPSNMIPLIHQYQMEMAAKKEEEKQPMPSYKEVREELSDKLGNLSRKEKRKLIKNKRNRMKRQQIQVKEETVHENEEVEKEEPSIALQKQARLWRERNQMMEEDNYSRDLQHIIKEKRRIEAEKEKEYLKSIAREVAKRNATSKKKEKEEKEHCKEEKKPTPEYCLSYLRTGACRYGYRCKHPHCIPKKSRGLLFHNLFQLSGEIDVDDSLSAYLEYTDDEIQQRFIDFFADLVPELKKFGSLQHLLVSSNSVPHLRGNVYAIWKTREEGERALLGLQGRYYAGRELDIEYLPESVMCWKYGLCSECWKKECNRGRECNFLHFYTNPGNEYMIEDHLWRRGDSHSREKRGRSYSRERGDFHSRERKRSDSHSRDQNHSHSRERKRSDSHSRK